MEKFDKLENLFLQFSKRFKTLYKPLLEGEFENPLAHSPEDYPIFPDAHTRFSRAQITFNQFALRFKRLGANTDYWLQRAFRL